MTCVRKGLVCCLDCPIVEFEPYGRGTVATDNVHKGIPLRTKPSTRSYVAFLIVRADTDRSDAIEGMSSNTPQQQAPMGEVAARRSSNTPS